MCVSEAPATLAIEVTRLLSQGWELYGHPFSDLPTHTNGSEKKANLFCQAMVRAEVAAAAPGPRPRPPRPSEPATFRNVAAFLAVLAGGYLLAECLIFRSGLYAGFTEPDSSTGSFEGTFKMEMDRKPSGKKEVLVVGSSRVAEGFSTRIANSYKPAEDYLFLNCSVPSAGDRAFYYMVRDLDPHRDRYAAIAIPIDDYDDPDDFEDVADRSSDIHLVINRLRITDIIPYTLSFTTLKSRRRVFRGAVFTGTTYQLDLADFIEHATTRLARVRDFREHGVEWANSYDGMDRTLAGMTVDWTNQRVTFPPSVTPDVQQYFQGNFFSRARQLGRMRAFELRWLIPIVDLYRNSKTRIVIFEMPRGPAPRPAAHLPWTAVDELRKRPQVIVIDRNAFEGLEKPELFGDHVHLNSTGRKIFSPMFADAVKGALQ